MSLIRIGTGDEALIHMSEYNWITYLPSNLMCSALVKTIKQNRLLKELFSESIADYRRDDFNVRELPALSIYEPNDEGNSRFFPLIGKVNFCIYLPIKIARQETEKIFNTLGQAFLLILQSEEFFHRLVDNLIPVPDPTSPIYADVVRYKAEFGAPIVNFGQKFNISLPNKMSIGGIGQDNQIGDVWKIELSTTYESDLSNFYAMLEEFGISFGWDPNEVVYPLWENFSIDVIPKE